MPLVRLARNLIASLSDSDEPEGTQYGAIPYQIIDDKAVFLMITSRRNANWVFPKGSEIKGLKPWEVAAQEALEEAGIKGKIEKEPIGSYLHPRNKDPDQLYEVQLFPMRVTEQFDDWLEKEERFRHWALMPEVRRLLASKDAASIAANLNRRILFPDQKPGSKRMSA